MRSLHFNRRIETKLLSVLRTVDCESSHLRHGCPQPALAAPGLSRARFQRVSRASHTALALSHECVLPFPPLRRSQSLCAVDPRRSWAGRCLFEGSGELKLTGCGERWRRIGAAPAQARRKGSRVWGRGRRLVAALQQLFFLLLLSLVGCRVAEKEGTRTLSRQETSTAAKQGSCS